MNSRTTRLVAAAGLCIASHAMAQFSSDPANNLAVANRANDQVQPKISPTADGGAYVSWYDNANGGYDVYLQRLDAAGYEQWPHNGVLIADRSVSSTVDYSLATDPGGNAVVVFVDDRFGAGRITLQKVSPQGNLLFNGAQGVNVGPGSTVASPPTVAVLADGNYGVIWMNTSSPAATVLQKVDSTTGALIWGASGIVQVDWLSPARPVEASDVQSDGAGGMIVLFVRCTGTNCVTSNKQLFAQRYDPFGAPQWNSGVPVTIFAGTGSIQTGTFPRFVGDSNGGGVFGWYETGGSRYAYIQHVLPDGTLKFASPVASTGVTTGRIRTGAAFTYNAASGEYFEAFDECDSSTQSNHVVNVQRFGSTGSLMWGNDGVALRGPEGFFQQFGMSVKPVGDGCMVVWTWLDNTNRGYEYAARVNGEATVAWNEQIASTFQGYSNRMTAALSTQGFCIVAMGAGATGNGDIQVARVNFNGSLGNPLPPCGSADFDCDGDIGTDADIEAFFACLAGTCPSLPCTSNADFNGDGDIGTDADIEAFFRVLGGGTC